MSKHTRSVSLIDGHIEDRDAEVIKALDDIVHIYSKDATTINGTRVVTLFENALDLINRQQAEIELLQHEILSCNTKIEVLQEVKEQLEKDVFNAQMNCDSIAYEYELLKQEKSVVQSEAIKEFAEQIKMAFYYEFEELIPSIMADKIGNLVKEMVGDE